jgi:RHS repeat-associated protein
MDAPAAIAYTYDTHGNMLNIANVDPGQQLRWDHRDMIGSLNLSGGENWAYYQYDTGKQRTRKQIVRTNSSNVKTVEERIYLGGYELYRRYVGSNPKPVEEIESHHLFEGEQRVLLVDDVITTDKAKIPTGPLFRYQYSNHLGSACLELDHKAEIISYEEYHPYGTSAYRAMKRGIEAPPKRYRYTGMERDEESGLSYHAARYYAPWLGRWVSPDPAGIADGVNLYLFASSNPLIFKDITGNQASAESSAPTPREIAEGRSIPEEHQRRDPVKERVENWTNFPPEVVKKLEKAGPGIYRLPGTRTVRGVDYRADWVIVKRNGELNGFQMWPSEKDLVKITGDEKLAYTHSEIRFNKEKDILRYMELGYDVHGAADQHRTDTEEIYKGTIGAFGDAIASAGPLQSVEALERSFQKNATTSLRGATKDADDIIRNVDPKSLTRTHNLSGNKSIRLVEEIAENMKNPNYLGPRTPIEVVEAEGKRLILDGHHRAAAARRTGTKVDIKVVKDVKSHPSSWNTIEEVLSDAVNVKPDRLFNKYRK